MILELTETVDILEWRYWKVQLSSKSGISALDIKTYFLCIVAVYFYNLLINSCVNNNACQIITMITNNFKMLYDMATYNNQIDQIVIVHCVNSIFVNVKGNKKC